MGFMDVLQQYLNVPPNQAGKEAAGHFEQVAQGAPPAMVQDGLTHAFRSDQTPPFEKMVGQLFAQSNPQQKAGLLEQLSQLIPATSGAGGILRNILGKLDPGSAQVTPSQADHIPADKVEEAVKRAAEQNPGVIDRVSEFYAQHPGLVKTLGSAALTIVLAKMANRMKG